MFESFLTTLLYIVTLLGLFFLPGFLCLRICFRSQDFSVLETMLYSFGLGVGLLDVVMLTLDRAGFVLGTLSISAGLLVALLGIYGIRFSPRLILKQPSAGTLPVETLTLSRSSSIIFLALLVVTIFIKTLSLSASAFPTSTDLGHHMYWSKMIAETGAIPSYAKIDVVVDEVGKASITDPRPIPDFIIGEHLPFAAIAQFTRLDFLSPFPVNFLLVLNLLSLIAVATLGYHLTRQLVSEKGGEYVFLISFLLLGPLYTLASPQTKYVSGGVVGNLFGNLFIPLVLLLFARAIAQKRGDFMALAIFFGFILAFTHHLSTLVLAFILLASLGTIIISRWDTLEETLRSLWYALRHPISILVLLGALAFLFFVAVPSYLDPSVIDSAVGTPTKATRTGLSFSQISNSSGLAKSAIALFGIGSAFFLLRKRIEVAFLFAWPAILLLMSLRPHWVFLDIPSSRIGSYLTFPLAMAGAFGLVFLFNLTKGTVPRPLRHFVFGITLIFIVANGLLENSQSYSEGEKTREALQTYAASQYLLTHASPESIILKDHNYVAADAWMKLFFMRDYGYPLSRGFFSRYEEGGKRRERCTLNMISIPNTVDGKRCFDETGVSLIVVNPRYDATQFEKSSDFARVFASDDLHIYERR